MRAVVQQGFGGTEQLSVQELPDPTPGEGEVLVRVTAAAVDRGTEVDPEHPGCGMVADLLQRAVPPEQWEVSAGPLAG
jgi:hypothetical protein